MLLNMNRRLILPPLGDAAAIFEFGMTFNGYEAFGSFEACAAAANARKRETLDDLRNELFFACRASRHCDNDSYLSTYAELRPLFVTMLAGSD